MKESKMITKAANFTAVDFGKLNEELYLGCFVPGDNQGAQ